MKSNLFKYIIFFIYTSLIYFLSVFTGSLATLIIYNFNTMLNYFYFVIYLIYIPFYLLYITEYRPPNQASEAIFSITILIIAIGIYVTPFVFWYIRQTIARAFIISLMGFIPGPGIVYIIDDIGPDFTLGIITGLLSIFFYLTLYFGDKLKKKYFPNNKFANKIRYLLTWPCLRT